MQIGMVPDCREKKKKVYSYKYSATVPSVSMKKGRRRKIKEGPATTVPIFVAPTPSIFWEGGGKKKGDPLLLLFL